jgi:hypothetical protein
MLWATLGVVESSSVGEKAGRTNSSGPCGQDFQRRRTDPKDRRGLSPSACPLFLRRHRCCHYIVDCFSPANRQSSLVTLQSSRLIYGHVYLGLGSRAGRHRLLRTSPRSTSAYRPLTTPPQGRAALVALRKSKGGAGVLGRSFYKGGFEPKMTRREAALILEMPYAHPPTATSPPG